MSNSFKFHHFLLLPILAIGSLVTCEVQATPLFSQPAQLSHSLQTPDSINHLHTYTHNIYEKQSPEQFDVMHFSMEDFGFVYGIYFLAVAGLNLVAIIGGIVSLSRRKGMYGWGVFGIVAGVLSSLVSIPFTFIAPLLGIPMLVLTLTTFGIAIANIIQSKRQAENGEVKINPIFKSSTRSLFSMNPMLSFNF